jgi:hypothetical protein
MKRFTLMLLLALAFANVNAQETMKLMVKFDDSKDLSQENLYQPYTRVSEVTLNAKILSDNACTVGDKVTINLFDDDSYSSTIDRINKNINGTVTIRARINDYPLGFLLLSTTDGLSLGTIWIPEKNERYSIKTSSKTGLTYLKRLDISKLDEIEGGPSLIAPGYPMLTNDQIEQFKSAAAKDPSDPANVDVMIVYTPAAASWASSNEGSILNTIAQAMEKAQLAAENSLLIMDFTLVHSEQVTYTESGSSSTDLYRLTFHEGFDPWGYEGTPRYLEEVHTWRELYGADLVSMFTQVDDTGGLGWLLAYQSGYPQLGFSISRVQQASWTFTHVHEMGHNMGAHHHKQQNVQPGPTVWNDWPENTWSAGWRWLGSDEQMYCDIMTYESGSYFSDGISAIRTSYFSNPNISHMGAPTGHAVDGDNARTLREIKHVIAAYTLGGDIEPPIISVEPETLYQALGYNSQASQTLTVYNDVEEGSNLNLSISIIYEDGKNSQNLSPELIPGTSGNQVSLVDQHQKPFSIENGNALRLLSSAKGASVLYVNTVSDDGVFSMALEDLPNVSNFEEVDATSVTPNVDYMLNFDVVIVASNSGFANSSLLGDNLADYVDAGGTVCMLQGSLSSGGGWTIGGNIATSEYLPLTITPFDISNATCTNFTEHPLTLALETISTGIWSLSSVQGAGVSLGNYDTGYPFAAYNSEKPIVAINVFPANGYWSGDLMQMMQNTIDWLISQKGWLSLNSYQASISQGDSQDFEVSFNSNELDQGVYEAVIRVTSNDPENPEIDIPVTLEVTFESFTLSLEANPVDGGTVEGAGDYYAGQQVSINATYNPGFMFVNWTDEEDVVLFTQASATYTMPAENKTLTAHFTDQFPIISLDPEYFEEILYVGETGESNLTIYNTGDFNLSFNIEVIDAKKNELKSVGRLREQLTQSENLKGIEIPNLHLNNPKTTSGGPDEFGYKWSTIAIDWIDASGGTSVSLSDDDYTTGIPLGFEFTYYGLNYSQVNIMSNGWVSFSNSDSWYPDCVPGGYGGAIVPFGLDLNPPAGGYIKYLTGGAAPQRFFVVEYNNIRLYGSDTFQTFQVVFYESNNAIRFQYLTAPVIPYSIGIENAYGDIGIGNCGDDDLYINPNIVANNMAIEFTLNNPDWLSLSSYSGTVLPGEQVDLDVLFDATELSLGTYDKIIRVSSNDPENPELDVPFTLNVVLELFNLTLEANPTEGGTVEGSGEYWEGHEVNINAIPNTGFMFVNWTDEEEVVLFTQASATFAMPAEDVTLTANFTDQIPSITVSPTSLEEDLETGQIATQTLTISNEALGNLTWSLSTQFVGSKKSRSLGAYADESRTGNNSLPQNALEKLYTSSKDLGDVLGIYYNSSTANTGMVWANGFLYMLNYNYSQLLKYDLATESVVETSYVTGSPYGITWDGEYLWVGNPSGNVYAYNLDGTSAGYSFSVPFSDYTALTWDGEYFVVNNAFGYNPTFYRLDETGTAIEAFTSSDNQYSYQIVYVPQHTMGHIWSINAETQKINQFQLQDGAASLVQQIENPYPYNYDYAITHDGTDLWWSYWGGPIYQIDDGIIESNWLSYDLESGNIPSGESQMVEITFDATGMFGGTYEAVLNITSNDPENPLVEVPVTLYVTGVPLISISSETLDFGLANLGVEFTLPLTISNPGTDMLEVTNIQTTADQFYTSHTELFINPLSSTQLLVYFYSEDPGLFEAELTFNTNVSGEESISIPLTAEIIVYELALLVDPVDGGTVTGDGEYEAGDEVTVTATPNPGFIFVKWTEDGEELTRQASYTFNMPAEDLTLVAHFTDKIPEITYDPDFFEEDLFTGDIVTSTLSISNTGDPESELYFTLDFEYISKLKGKGITVSVNKNHNLSSQPNINTAYFSSKAIDVTNTEFAPNTSDSDITFSKNFTIDDLQFSFPVGVGDGEYGVGCDGNYIYTTRWSGDSFYKYSLDGEYLETFTIAGVGNIRDLTYDGQYFYGSPNNSIIYIMDFSSQTLMGTITTSVPNIRAIAYDSNNDGFWISNDWQGPLTLVNRDGGTLETLVTSIESFAGLLWENVSDDGPFLWAYTQAGNTNRLYQIDMTTGNPLVTFDVETLGILSGSSGAGGLFFTDGIIPGEYTILGMCQNDVIWGLSLGQSSSEWLSLSEIAGILNYGESIDIDVTFDATGLFGGVYEAIIAISSNDPENSEVIIPVTMNVTGIPIIELSHEILDFGDVQINVPEIFELTIYNVGTQTLEVTDIESSLSNFTVSETELFISPMSNAVLLVTFESDVAGLFEATLSFETNDANHPTVALDMFAEAKLPPAISVSPTSFYENLGYNDSTEGTLTITNNGGMPLEFTIVSFLDTSNPSKIKFDQTINLGEQTLMMENHPEKLTIKRDNIIQYNEGNKGKTNFNILIYEEVPDFFWYTNALGGLGYDYTLATTWDAIEIALSGKTDWDLIVINSYDNSAGTTTLDALNSYISSGGKLIFAHWQAGDFSSHPISSSMGISYISSFTTPINFSLTDEATILNTPNVLPNDFIWTNNQYNVDGQIVEALEGATVLATFSGYPSSGAIVLNEGGNTVFNAFQSDNFSGDSNSSGKDDVQELIENQIIYLLANNLVVSPTSGTIFPGEDFDITVTFSSNGLLPGIYEGEINIESNDPENPVIDVQVTLDVDYEGPVYYSLTLLTDPNDIGAVVSGAGNYIEGATVNISASWVSGYTFTGWTGSADDVSLLGNPLAATTSLSMPARSVSLTATYEEEVPFDCYVTFRVDMTDAFEFDPEEDVVYITGSMIGWTQPGNDLENQTMTRMGETMIWAKTLVLETGEYQYKYFLNDGWDGGEWPGDPNREIYVTGNMIQNDIWGEIVDTYSVTLLASPNNIGAVITGSGNYYEDAEVSITASSVAGYIFIGWSGIAEDIELLDDATELETFFTMPARAVTLTANYEEETNPTYTVTFTVRNANYDGIAGATISIAGEGTLTTNANGVATTSLENGTYSYTVTATGYYSHSGSFTVTNANQQVSITMIAVSVDTDILSSLEVFPNPFSSSITLNNASKVSRLTITNIIGQQVMDMQLSGSDRITIPTDGLTNGIYLMTFYAENGERVIRKMVKD